MKKGSKILLRGLHRKMNHNNWKEEQKEFR